MVAFAPAVADALDPARVVLCMLYDDAGARYGDIAADINRRYAVRHGFAFHVKRQNVTYFENLSPAWQKVGLIRELLRAPEYDIVVWIDADAAFQEHAADPLPSSSSPPPREAAAADALAAPHSLASILDRYLFGRTHPRLSPPAFRHYPSMRNASGGARVARDVLLSSDRTS